MEEDKPHNQTHFHEVIAKLINVIILLIIIILIMFILLYTGLPHSKPKPALPEPEQKLSEQTSAKQENYWQMPDTNQWATLSNQKEIRYGKELIVNTAFYFGPHGKIAHSGNGMNCQNCHLEAGTKVFGNNYSAVLANYPKFRERSGTIESIAKRVNDCFERSLNGVAIDSSSLEMKSIIAYISWLGKDIPKGEKPKGAGLKELAFLDRAADAEKGKLVFETKCSSCHQKNGQGKFSDNQITYQYPPLWGKHSYNIGAGLYRLSRFAAYVKYNMPQGATFNNPQLSDEEAWDVAAFVNSQEHPPMNLKNDWPKISAKPIDHPFGPYSDGFSEKEHKYGPFAAMVKQKNN